MTVTSAEKSERSKIVLFSGLKSVRIYIAYFIYCQGLCFSDFCPLSSFNVTLIALNISNMSHSNAPPPRPLNKCQKHMSYDRLTWVTHTRWQFPFAKRKSKSQFDVAAGFSGAHNYNYSPHQAVTYISYHCGNQQSTRDSRRHTHASIFVHCAINWTFRLVEEGLPL